MRNNIFKKSLVVGLIILFVGAIFTLNIFIRNVRADPGDVVNSFDSPGSNPLGLAWDGTYLWNVDNDDDKIYKLDPSDGSVIDSFNSPDSAPWGLMWDGNYLWNSNHETGPGMIYKLDPSDGSVIDSFSAPGSDPCDLAWDGNYLWNTDHETDMIYKLDPSDGSVIDSFSAPGSSPMGLTWDGLYLWNADNFNNTIYQIDVSYENQPPSAPTITGETNGKVGEEYCWNISSVDPDYDDIMYIVEWGDGEITETECYPSGEEVEVCHTYAEPGTYVIKVKEKECPDGLESDWSELEVTMPRNRAIQNTIFLWFLEQFPIFQWLFQRLIGLQ